MKRLALYAAAAAVAMTGTGTISSQAAVGTFAIGGNCPVSSNSDGNDCSYLAGQILQSLFAGGSGNGCQGSLNSMPGSGSPVEACTDGGIYPSAGVDSEQPGCTDSICPDTSGCPGTVICPDLGTWGTGNSVILIPGGGNCNSQYPGILNPGGQNSGNCGQGNQNQGNGNQGSQIPGGTNPGGTNPGGQNPGTQNPGTVIPGGTNPGSQPSEDSYVQQVIDLVNEERAKAGLSPVTEAADVSAAAAVRAQEITRSFSHTRPNGGSYSTVLDENGIRYMGSGENIAYGQKTPEAVMNGWMNSQGHRANILNRNYTKIGVGYYQNANGVGYWVQLFTY